MFAYQLLAIVVWCQKCKTFASNAGSTFAPEGQVENEKGQPISQASITGLSEIAACSGLCNESTLYYDKGKASTQKSIATWIIWVVLTGTLQLIDRVPTDPINSIVGFVAMHWLVLRSYA